MKPCRVQFVNEKVKEAFEKLNDENLKEFIERAFYDDEGNVGKKNIRLFQDKKDILEEIKKTLLSFKISSLEVKSYLKRGKIRYYFDIFRKTNFKKFKDNRIYFLRKNE